MSDLGVGYSLMNAHKNLCVISGNPFSVKCVLTNLQSVEQGRCGVIDESSTDSLKGIPNFIGLQISSDTGLPIMGDSAEFLLDINDVKIGRPDKKWKIEFPLQNGIWQEFTITSVMEDRTAGVYRLEIGIVSQTAIGRRIVREGARPCL